MQQLIELARITPSPTNPRTHFDEDALNDLAASIGKHGVLQPVLVRPCKEVGWEYELVCGRRRFLAAKKAGLTQIPATVRELDDTEALEVQVIENLQREGIHPLEEADGYFALVNVHGHSAESLAAKIGKSRGYVYQRLSLAKLPEAARELMWKGDMNVSLAMLVARIPDEELQREAAEKILHGHRTWEDGKEHWLPLTVKAATELVQDEYMLELKGAPFNTTEETLVAEAGACTLCPKRTGNVVDLFGDVGGRDMCTDPPCFRRKTEATWGFKSMARVAQLRERGRKASVLTIAQSERALYWDGKRISPGAIYVSPAEPWDGDKKKRKPIDIVTAKAVEAPTTFLARHPKTGNPVDLWKRSELHTVLNGGKKPEAKEAAEPESPKQPERDFALEGAIRNLATVEFDRQIDAKVATLTADQLVALLLGSLGKGSLDYWLRMIGAPKTKLAQIPAETARRVVARAWFDCADVDSDAVARVAGVDYAAIERAAREKATAEREQARAAAEAKKAKADKNAKPAATAKGVAKGKKGGAR